MNIFLLLTTLSAIVLAFTFNSDNLFFIINYHLNFLWLALSACAYAILNVDCWKAAKKNAELPRDLVFVLISIRDNINFSNFSFTARTVLFLIVGLVALYSGYYLYSVIVFLNLLLIYALYRNIRLIIN